MVRRGGTGYSLRSHANLPLATDVAGLRLSGDYRKDPGFIYNQGTGETNSNDLVAKGLIGNLLLRPAPDLTIRIGGILHDLKADGMNAIAVDRDTLQPLLGRDRSEEHTSELQSLMRISYAVFCLKKKKLTNKYAKAPHQPPPTIQY